MWRRWGLVAVEVVCADSEHANGLFQFKIVMGTDD